MMIEAQGYICLVCVLAGFSLGVAVCLRYKRPVQCPLRDPWDTLPSPPNPDGGPPQQDPPPPVCGHRQPGFCPKVGAISLCMRRPSCTS
jgi:hypothetical protein